MRSDFILSIMKTHTPNVREGHEGVLFLQEFKVLLYSCPKEHFLDNITIRAVSGIKGKLEANTTTRRP